MYASKSRFLDKAIGHRKLLTIYHTINSLLDTQPELINQANLAQLKSLLNPLPNQKQLNLGTMLSYKRNAMIFYDVLNFDAVFQDTTSQDYKRLKEIAAEENIPLTFDFNKTINKDYQAYTANIYIANLTLPQSATVYQKIKDRKSNSPTHCSTELASFRETIFKKLDKTNILGDYMLCGSDQIKYMADFVYTLFNVQNYLALVNLQLAIKQKSIAKDQIPQFLIESGDHAINPYTQKPFTWNADKSTISTDTFIVNKNYKPKEDKDMTIKIQF